MYCDRIAYTFGGYHVIRENYLDKQKLKSSIFGSFISISAQIDFDDSIAVQAPTLMLPCA